MIHVTKNEEPQWFAKWKQKSPQGCKQSYDKLSVEEKEKLKQELIDEQGALCCYCGRRITADDSHVEHFRPQKSYGNLDVSYDNLFASCIKEAVKGKRFHCGHSKGSQFDEQLAISPLDEHCEPRFIYTLAGEVMPTDDADNSASFMIDLLRLNHPSLKNERKNVLEGILYGSPGDVDLISLSDDDLRKLRDLYRERDERGAFEPFVQVVTRYIDQMIGNA